MDKNDLHAMKQILYNTNLLVVARWLLKRVLKLRNSVLVERTPPPLKMRRKKMFQNAFQAILSVFSLRGKFHYFFFEPFPKTIYFFPFQGGLFTRTEFLSFKTLSSGHIATTRRPASYRICFMTCRSLLANKSFSILLNKRVGGSGLSRICTIFLYC